MLVREKEAKAHDAVGFSVQEEEWRESNWKFLPSCVECMFSFCRANVS